MMGIVLTTKEHLAGFQPLNDLPDEYMTIDAIETGMIPKGCSLSFVKDGVALALFGRKDDGAVWLVPSAKLMNMPVFFARRTKIVCDAIVGVWGPFWVGVSKANKRAQSFVKFLKFDKIDEVENMLIFSYGGNNG